MDKLQGFRALCDARAAWTKASARVELEMAIYRANLRQWTSPAARTFYLAPFIYSAVEAKTMIEIQFGVTL